MKFILMNRMPQSNSWEKGQSNVQLISSPCKAPKFWRNVSKESHPMKPVFRKWGHQGEEAYDSEEVSIQPDEGLQPPRPAGFILCFFNK